MWNDLLKETKASFKDNFKISGIVIISILNIVYLLKFIRIDCNILGGIQTINITGLICLIFSEQHFLTFMIPLSIIYGMNILSRTSLLEVVKYKGRDRWMKSLIIKGCIYSILYFLMIVIATIVLAYMSGISFSDMRMPCDGMDYIIPGLMVKNPYMDMLYLSIANLGNLFFYCLTIGLFYILAFSITSKRVGAVFTEIIVLILILVLTKNHIQFICLYGPLGNIILDFSYIKDNAAINWMYWVLLNVVQFGLIFFINRKRSFYHDE